MILNPFLLTTYYVITNIQKYGKSIKGLSATLPKRGDSISEKQQNRMSQTTLPKRGDSISEKQQNHMSQKKGMFQEAESYQE